MKILAIKEGHDGNWCIFDDQKNKGEIKYFSAERERCSKHLYVSTYGIYGSLLSKYGKDGFDYIVVSFGDLRYARAAKNSVVYEEISNRDNIYRSILKKNTGKIFYVDHHFAHILQNWTGVEDYGAAIDGAGDEDYNETFTKNIIKSINQNTLEYSDRTQHQIGRLFKFVASTLLKNTDKDDCVGKIMGIQAYGKINESLYETLLKTKDYDKLKSIIYDNLKDIDVYNKDDNFDNIYTINNFLSKKIIKLFDKNFGDTERKVLYDGGCALNTVTNTVLDYKYNLSINPAANDSGISIGLMKLMLYINGYNLKTIKVKNGSYLAEPNDSTLDKVAKLLADGNIVAFCTRNDELGPRALGGRSILMDPSIKNGKNIINNKVKHREWWRPFGGTIIDSSILKNYKKSELDYFMLKNSKFEKKYRDKFVSINHKDNTSRLQILSEENKNEPIYKVIEKFNSLTGIPGLLNTSYNIQSKPIPSKDIDIIITFYSIPRIRYLLFGDKLYDKKEDDVMSIICNR